MDMLLLLPKDLSPVWASAPQSSSNLTRSGQDSLCALWIDDPQIKAALQAKYTPRGRDPPTHVTKGQYTDRLEGLRENLLGLKPGVAAGFGGAQK